MTASDWVALSSATATVFTGLVFGYAGWHKASDFASFTGFVADYELLPPRAVTAVSAVLGTVEAFVVLALLFSQTRPLGCCLAIALLLIYAAAMAINLVRGRNRIECGCGGAPQHITWFLVGRNLLLAGIAAVALLSPHFQASAGAVIATFASGFLLWIGLVLMEQILGNGVLARSSEPAGSIS